MKPIALIWTICLLAIFSACKKAGSGSTGGSPSSGDTTKTTTAADCFQVMQSLTINAIRLRIWGNPANGLCGTSDVVAKAVRAHNLGLRVLLDFHYSDTWADPGHQTKPAAWTALDFPTLTSTFSSYTIGVLDTLKPAGVIPSRVQIGNEIDNGMLWPDGQASTNMAQFNKPAMDNTGKPTVAMNAFLDN